MGTAPRESHDASDDGRPRVGRVVADDHRLKTNAYLARPLSVENRPVWSYGRVKFPSGVPTVTSPMTR